MKEKKLFVFLVFLVSIVMLPIGVFAENDDPYRLRSHHDYPNTDGEASYFSDLCIMDDDGYAIFGIHGNIETQEVEINVIRYDSKYEVAYNEMYHVDNLDATVLLSGKLIPLPEGNLIVNFPGKALLIDNSGKLVKTVDLPSNNVNPIVRLGNTLVSVTPTKIYQYDLGLQLMKEKDLSLSDNQIMMFSNIDHEASFLHVSTLYDINSNLDITPVMQIPEGSVFTPLVKIKGNKYISLSMDENNQFVYVVADSIDHFLLSHKDYAASGYLAMGHMFFGIMAQIKYAEELDNGYVFTNQIISEDNQTCTISLSVYDNNYQPIFEKEITKIPAFGANQSQNNLATILNSVARLRNGDFVMLYTTGHVPEDLEVHDEVYTYKRTVEVEEGTEDVYFDTDYYKPGETVQIKFRKRDGYVVDDISVKKVENKDEVKVNDDDYTFTMPDADVSVGVQWRKSSAISQITENPKTGILFSIISIGIIVIVLTIYEVSRFKKKSSN